MFEGIKILRSEGGNKKGFPQRITTPPTFSLAQNKKGGHYGKTCLLIIHSHLLICTPYPFPLPVHMPSPGSGKIIMKGGNK